MRNRISGLMTMMGMAANMAPMLRKVERLVRSPGSAVMTEAMEP